MKKTLSKGFTLIELLVVIAIIGILAGVVLTSLGTARDKAKEASAIASMSAMRAEAELGVSSSGNYQAALCTINSTDTGTLGKLGIAAEKALGGDGTAWNKLKCNFDTGSPTAWAVGTTVALKSGSYYCVDSVGFSGEIATELADTTYSCQ